MVYIKVIMYAVGILILFILALYSWIYAREMEKAHFIVGIMPPHHALRVLRMNVYLALLVSIFGLWTLLHEV